MGIYFQKWMFLYQYLREHFDVGWSLFEDPTRNTHDIDPDMLSLGKLYAEIRPFPISKILTGSHYIDQELQKFIRLHRESPVISDDIICGDRSIVLDLCHRVLESYDYKKKTTRRDELLVFNKIIYEEFQDKISDVFPVRSV